jgi:hypothetical protein
MITMSFLHYMRTIFIGEQARHSLTAYKNKAKEWLLLLGSKTILNEALRQTLKMEVVKLAVGFSIRLQRRCEGASHLPSKRRDYRQFMCQHCRSTSHFWKLCPQRLEEEMMIHC